MSRWVKLLMWLAVLALAAVFPMLTEDNRMMTIAIQTFILASLASSWNILGGYAGPISLGHAAFFGLGALITRELWLGGQSVAVALVVAAVATAAVAALVGIPLLRFRDVYFSIGTLALGVAVWLTIGNVRPGISSLPVEQLRSYTFTGPYYLALGVLVALVVVSTWLKYAKLGLGMMAVRDDEQAAGATGVNVVGHKLSAFTLSAALASLAGSAFAIFSVSYYPQFPFSVIWTFDAILVVFIGGIGTVVGPLIGSLFFVAGRDMLASTFEDIQVILFGVLFIIVVLVLPGGIVEGTHKIFTRVFRRGTSQQTESKR